MTAGGPVRAARGLSPASLRCRPSHISHRRVTVRHAVFAFLLTCRPLPGASLKQEQALLRVLSAGSWLAVGRGRDAPPLGCPVTSTSPPSAGHVPLLSPRRLAVSRPAAIGPRNGPGPRRGGRGPPDSGVAPLSAGPGRRRSGGVARADEVRRRRFMAAPTDRAGEGRRGAQGARGPNPEGGAPRPPSALRSCPPPFPACRAGPGGSPAALAARAGCRRAPARLPPDAPRPPPAEWEALAVPGQARRALAR